MSAIALDPLIAEAKRRARRRRAVLLAAVAIGAAGALTYGLLPTRGSVERGTRPGERVTGTVSGASARRPRGVGEVGSAGGVTWVMNGRGIWLTQNGGRAWRKVAIPRGTGFFEEQGSYVQFVDPQHGWISINELTGHPPHRGVRSMFARTTDGGRTWQPSFPADCHGRCGSGGMSFVDARHGFLLTYEPGTRTTTKRLFRTADGGQTWHPVSKVSMWGPITFLTDRVGFAFPSGNEASGVYLGPPIGTLYRTTDGGRTWSRYDIGGSKSFVEEPIAVVGHRVVVVQNGDNGGGVNLAPGTIYVSADGRHWRGSAVPGPPAVASSFTAASSSAWVFSSFSAGHYVYTTHDSGRHWRKISLPNRPKRFRQLPEVGKVNFTSSRAGWVVVGRKLYRTTDGGLHWAAAGPPRGKPAPVHACEPSQLRISFWSSHNLFRRAEGHLEFSNTGSFGCRLSGWPTVVAVEADGTTVQAKRSLPAGVRSLPSRPIVLGPGRGKWANVDAPNVRAGSGSASCPRAVSLRVTPPGGHRIATLAGPWRVGGSRTFYLPLCGGISVTPFFRH